MNKEITFFMNWHMINQSKLNKNTILEKCFVSTSSRVSEISFWYFLTQLEQDDFKNLFWKVHSRNTVCSTCGCVIIPVTTKVFCYRSDSQALF